MGIRLILEWFVKDDSSSDIKNHKFYRNLPQQIRKMRSYRLIFDENNRFLRLVSKFLITKTIFYLESNCKSTFERSRVHSRSYLELFSIKMSHFAVSSLV